MVKTGSIVWPVDSPNDYTWSVVDPHSSDGEAIVLEAHRTKAIRYARLTGKTRRFWGIDCPTLDVFEVSERVVVDPRTGRAAIFGEAGKRIGRFATRPENQERG